jgi:hypothetical protein
VREWDQETVRFPQFRVNDTSQKERWFMYKPTGLLDPKFKYVPARNTDIAKTFARIRREQARSKAMAMATITPIKKERKQA